MATRLSTGPSRPADGGARHAATPAVSGCAGTVGGFPGFLAKPVEQIVQEFLTEVAEDEATSRRVCSCVGVEVRRSPPEDEPNWVCGKCGKCFRQ